MISLFRNKCAARLHWGKAGWPRHAACFDGAKEYSGSWCDFGCAVRQLDPGNKFQSQADVWYWNTLDAKTGQPVAMDSCCTANGFDYAKCKCGPRSCGK